MLKISGRRAIRSTLVFCGCLLVGLNITQANADEELKSWRDTPAREAITTFVDRVTAPDSSDFVDPVNRIAVFDNDGTLWAERPVYFQLLFAVDEARRQLAVEPSLASESPYREIVAGKLDAIAAGGEEALLGLVMKTHAGQTEAEFTEKVLDWVTNARHPTSERVYTEMVYQPMLELLDYLRSRSFSVWIVSGGGQSFMRPWTESVYGIPPEQVVGSQLAIEYQGGEAPLLRRNASFAHINDKGGKPVGIQRAIGKRPLLAVGNSDGDYAMLEWTTAGDGPRMGMLIHHTDGEREWAYDRDSHVGRLQKGLDDADEKGWLVVDMKADWEQVFPD